MENLVIADQEKRENANQALIDGFVHSWLAEKVRELEKTVGVDLSGQNDEGGWMTTALFGSLEKALKAVEEKYHSTR